MADCCCTCVIPGHAYDHTCWSGIEECPPQGYCDGGIMDCS